MNSVTLCRWIFSKNLMRCKTTNLQKCCFIAKTKHSEINMGNIIFELFKGDLSFLAYGSILLVVTLAELCNTGDKSSK